MVTRLLGIRREDRRDAIVAFLTLLGAMTGHAVLETARDTMFLSELPARQLPWAYLAIAALTLFATSVNRAALLRFPRRKTLALTLLSGAVVTESFWWLSESAGPVVLFALYVWTGLLATVVVVQFWLLLAQHLDVGQAKRLFAFIGAGGLIGAAVGSAASGALLMWYSPRALLFVAAGFFAATAGLPLLLSRVASAPQRTRRHQLPTGSGLRLLTNEPYLRRLFWVVLVASVLVTGVDYLFKAMVSTDVATDELGMFFARFYAVMNVLALVVQLLIAPRLLRVLGVNGSLLLLPAILLVASVGFVATAGLGSALLLRGADGSLRHSLNRTSTEILYVPLPPDIRDRFKSFAEAVGQRGGQGIASLLILGAVVAGASPTHLGLGLVLLSLLWLVTIYGLKPHYLDLFRRNLREGKIETHVEVSALDLHSFEALISALSSENDQEVLGALEILAAYGKTNLVPALILYHPSPEVVLRAFDLFTNSQRTDVDRLTARLLKHADPQIRAAALRSRAARHTEEELVRRLAEDDSPLVSTTATVHLVRGGFVDEWRGGDVIRGIIDGESAEKRVALAYAARDLPPGRYSWALIRLAGIREPGLALQVARSMAASPDPEFVPTLVRMLAYRDCRDDARAAILALGDAALDRLEKAFDDPTLTPAVRRHLPRTISRAGHARAAEILMRRLPKEADETVVLKILRGLGRMRADDPTLRIDRRTLLDFAAKTLQRAMTMAAWRAVVDVHEQSAPEHASPAAELLSALLADIETNALERVFRLLQIIQPREEFRMMHAGLTSADHRVRANSRELIGNVVSEPLRTGVLAMTDEGSVTDRLRLATAFHRVKSFAELESVVMAPDAGERIERIHVDCLKNMLLDTSEALSSVASYRIAELGVEELQKEVAAAHPEGRGALVQLSEHAREALSAASQPEATNAR